MIVNGLMCSKFQKLLSIPIKFIKLIGSYVIINDYSELAEINSLRNIELHNVNEDGINNLGDLLSIDNLSINDMTLNNVEWISNINIAKLTFAHCSICDPSQLGDGNNITYLSLCGMNENVINDFGELNKLSILDLSESGLSISDFSFKCFDSLQTIVLSGLTYDEVSVVIEAPNLKEVLTDEIASDDGSDDVEGIFENANIRLVVKTFELEDFADLNYYYDTFFYKSTNYYSSDEYLSLKKKGVLPLYYFYREKQKKMDK